MEDAATSQELREDWRKAEERTELFTPHSLMWMEAREEANAARRVYMVRLRMLSKRARFGDL